MSNRPLVVDMIKGEMCSVDYKERFTLYFEMKDGLYKPGAFFWAKVITSIPDNKHDH